MTLSKKLWKNYFLFHCSFIQLFHNVEKLRRKPKSFVKVIQRFWYAQHTGLILFISTRSSQSCKFGKILQCWKNLAMLLFSRLTVCNHHFTHIAASVQLCVLQQGSHYQIQGQRNGQPKNLENRNNSLLCWLRVWLFGGLAETSLNQFVQKLPKITLHANWNCAAQKTVTYVIEVAYEREKAYLFFFIEKVKFDLHSPLPLAS